MALAVLLRWNSAPHLIPEPIAPAFLRMLPILLVPLLQGIFGGPLPIHSPSALNSKLTPWWFNNISQLVNCIRAARDPVN